MITTEQSNDLTDKLATLVTAAENAGELYALMVGINDVLAQRAAEIRNAATPNSEQFGFAVQVHKDASHASDNAARMSAWFDSITE